jgi:mono/diheme cytochrome c family protein
VCAVCHQADGTGQTNVAASLVGSRWVTGDAGRLVRIVLHGKEGRMLMPPAGSTLTDEQLAAVLTYVRRAWGNEASPVTPGAVAETRGATAGRRRPWTEAELLRVAR